MADPAPDRFDDTSTNHEQFETERLAQNRDAGGVATADIDTTTAHNQVSDLVDADVVTPVPAGRVLVHEPSGAAFESMLQLAVFHEGWTAAVDAGETDE